MIVECSYFTNVYYYLCISLFPIITHYSLSGPAATTPLSPTTPNLLPILPPPGVGGSTPQGVVPQGGIPQGGIPQGGVHPGGIPILPSSVSGPPLLPPPGAVS